MAHNDIQDVLPPPGPPPLLCPEDIRHLAVNGWLPLDLDEPFRHALDRLSQSTTRFFEQDYKTKRTLYPAAKGTECGFYHVAEEKEYLTIRYQADVDHDLERASREVWRLAGVLLYRILADISRAGGLDVSVWNTLLEDSLEMPKDAASVLNDEVLTFMRLFQYYPCGGFADEHIDLGLLTLCVGNGKGLQVLDRTSVPPQWIDADRPTIVVGDFLRTLLKNRVRAGLHRVISNIEGRTSTIFALRPCLRHELDLKRFGGDEVVDTREFYDKIKRSKFNINATKEIREKQRLDTQARKAGS